MALVGSYTHKKGRKIITCFHINKYKAVLNSTRTLIQDIRMSHINNDSCNVKWTLKHKKKKVLKYHHKYGAQV